MLLSFLFVRCYESYVKHLIRKNLKEQTIDWISADEDILLFWFVKQDSKIGKPACFIWSIALGLDEIIDYCNLSREQLVKYYDSLIRKCKLNLSPYAEQCIASGLPCLDVETKDLPPYSEHSYPFDEEQNCFIEERVCAIMDIIDFSNTETVLPIFIPRFFKRQRKRKPKEIKTIRGRIASRFGKHISKVK